MCFFLLQVTKLTTTVSGEEREKERRENRSLWRLVYMTHLHTEDISGAEIQFYLTFINVCFIKISTLIKVWHLYLHHIWGNEFSCIIFNMVGDVMLWPDCPPLAKTTDKPIDTIQ